MLYANGNNSRGPMLDGKTEYSWGEENTTMPLLSLSNYHGHHQHQHHDGDGPPWPRSWSADQCLWLASSRAYYHPVTPCGTTAHCTHCRLSHNANSSPPWPPVAPTATLTLNCTLYAAQCTLHTLNTTYCRLTSYSLKPWCSGCSIFCIMHAMFI